LAEFSKGLYQFSDELIICAKQKTRWLSELLETISGYYSKFW